MSCREQIEDAVRSRFASEEADLQRLSGESSWCQLRILVYTRMLTCTVVYTWKCKSCLESLPKFAEQQGFVTNARASDNWTLLFACMSFLPISSKQPFTSPDRCHGLRLEFLQHSWTGPNS